MSESVIPSPRPTPRFYKETQVFSTKKLRPSGTPRDHIPPRPPVKSCPPLSRLFPHRNVISYHAQPVSFRHSESSLLSPKYNENSNDLYFEQMFDHTIPIGFGSFGEVFKCRSKEDGKFYAIKKSREPFRGQCDRKRKMEEVAKHEELLPHPNCIRFFRAWEERGFLYIQTELCQMSVSEFCNRNQHLAESLIWNYLVDLLMALKHLHDHNLVHMDIKPDNAFISFDGICKLGDFGLVIDLTKKRDVTDAIEGDPKYLAPELLEGQFGKHADIFSLGMFILELLTDLELPRGGEGWHLLRSGNMPDNFFKDRSSDIMNVIKQMLDPDYKSRPTVDQILALPCVREVMKKRLKSFMVSGGVKKISKALRSSPTAVSTPVFSRKSQAKAEDVDTFAEEDEHMEIPGAHSNTSSDLLDSSDEFVMPSNPPPRRAFTTPAIRRRPATSSFSCSPIKRLLFQDDNLSSTPSSVANQSSDGIDPDGQGSSPTSTRSWSSFRTARASSATPSSKDSERPGTPPTGRPLTNMDCDDRDEPRVGVEPKNLLGMFEAASDEEL
ncbi:hypothetical protein RRG08_006279 [Elysia crispata]|uniref:Membrane-associated tyrosine- and threonine-specific cdc2-inhibitory kinase n=1 Tax=Elysia crispata TaxID=231223 RepID=A0AAE0YPS6_9GAST|nr:hypothetical protein RRG08_006279 [Elysia crispata]